MAETIEITIERAANQKSITITDSTDWTAVTGTIDSLTSIVLSFYTSSTASADETYTFSAAELSEYTANGTINLTFLEVFGSTYVLDNGYKVQMVGNTDAYASNYAFFGTYYYVKNIIYTKYVNGLATPERDISIMQPIHYLLVCLKGLEELDNTNILSRDIKFTKRLSALTKMVS